MKWIKYYLLRRLRRMTVANDRIVVGDLYRGNRKFDGIIVMATHGIPKSEFDFCGAVIKVDPGASAPVGAVQNHFPVRYFTWCEPREKIELHN